MTQRCCLGVEQVRKFQMNVIEDVGHESLAGDFRISIFSMIGSRELGICPVCRSRARSVVDRKVSDGLRLPVGIYLEVLRAKVSYRVAVRVANHHAYQNQVDGDLEGSRILGGFCVR
jgi:hypothetical protein